jgi:hypothetical protein
MNATFFLVLVLLMGLGAVVGTVWLMRWRRRSLARSRFNRAMAQSRHCGPWLPIRKNWDWRSDHK